MSTTLWLTGLPCSGKTTIAEALREAHYPGHQLLDGDVVRNFVRNPDMSLEGRALHLAYIAMTCRMLNDHGIGVICSFVSPTNAIRANIRTIIGPGRIFNVWVKADRDTCIERDVKGMWKKAIEGQITNFTGWDGAWDDPDTSDLVLDTVRQSVEESRDSVHEAYEAWKQGLGL